MLPLVGGLVEGFGRKSILLTFICFFCVGSVLCGTAVSMRMLILGRGELPHLYAFNLRSDQPLDARGSQSIPPLLIRHPTP